MWLLMTFPEFNGHEWGIILPLVFVYCPCILNYWWVNTTAPGSTFYIFSPACYYEQKVDEIISSFHTPSPSSKKQRIAVIMAHGVP